MPQLAPISDLPDAFALIKEMRLRFEDPEDTLTLPIRSAARQALAQTLDLSMRDYISSWLDQAHRMGLPDRRNGSYHRHLLTELGDIVLEVPRTRTTSAVKVLSAYAQRTQELDRLILACFLLGLSTRKTGEALHTILGETVSASTVSRIAKRLDQAVAAFHSRPIDGSLYRALVLDGVVLSRKTGAGAIRRPVLVALGIRHDGRKEVLDFRLARAESEAEWTTFLTDLYKRGLTEASLEVVCTDGGSGLLNALPTVYPHVPVQRCWAHKVRNLLDDVKKKDRKALAKDLRRIYTASTKRKAQKAARRFADRWEDRYPKVVASLRNDLDSLLTFFRFKSSQWRTWTRTTNAIERRFREVKRRTRPMGVMSDRASMERILYAVFIRENKAQGISPLFLLTHNL